MKKLFVLIISITFLFSSVVYADWDDPWTTKINEGAIGSGYDDPWTTEINEGSINDW